MAKGFFPTIGVSIALCLASVSAPASAAGFTPEGHQHWLEVAKALTAATHAEAENMLAPCPGFSALSGSAEIRREYFQVPRWAVNAHGQTCVAFNVLAKGGKGFMHVNSGDVCKILKSAVGELGKAKTGVDPDDVVAAAAELKSALVSLGGDLKGGNACRLA